MICSIIYPFVVYAQQNSDYKSNRDEIRKYIYKDYKEMYRSPGGALSYPFLVPGGKQYGDALWDWDSWLSNVALRQILTDENPEGGMKEVEPYERGCVLNYLSFSGIDGWIPVCVPKNSDIGQLKPADIYKENMHKPCLAQHAAFIVQQDKGNAEWLRNEFYRLQYFVDGYVNRYRDRTTGLYFWQNDVMIGVDNDPCTFFRPDRSSASIFLNCMMYKELKAMEYLSDRLDYKEIAGEYEKEAEKLKTAIQENCWDERDGFFYSVDLNLRAISPNKETYHGGAPRSWNCLIQRIDVWSGFLAMWAGIATPEQAKRMVEEHYDNKNTFNAPYGIRTLSKMEKMYSLKASGNPSNWLGPVWGVSNYLVWRGLVKYGYKKEAKELATKTVLLFGQDYRRTGSLHEYYQPSNGLPILNPGFQDWNMLVINMIDWIEGKKVVSEF